MPVASSPDTKPSTAARLPANDMSPVSRNPRERVITENRSGQPKQAHNALTSVLDVINASSPGTVSYHQFVPGFSFGGCGIKSASPFRRAYNERWLANHFYDKERQDVAASGRRMTIARQRRQCCTDPRRREVRGSS